MRDGHLARAERAIARAQAEYREARRTKDELAAGQAAEKAWLAVTEATKAFLRLKGVPERQMPEGHRGMFFLLRKYGGQDMPKAYDRALGTLHANAFYRGIVEWGSVEEAIGQAETLVLRVRQSAPKGWG